MAKTKIIATIGPACSSKEIIRQLVDAGARILRLNFSHGDSSHFVSIIESIRAVEREQNVSITILQDLSGPKIRIGEIAGGTLSFQKGDLVILGPAPSEGDTLPYIPFTNVAILDELATGDLLVLADGSMQWKVKEKLGDSFVLVAENSGLVTSRKGLALPGKTVKLPALTEKDKIDLREGLRLGVDAVALSYVQTPEDILEARAIIREARKDIPICAKLERKNAVDRLDDILAVADIIMVARGDLGVECPLPLLPAMQKRIIRACNKANTPVIVATQMLLSMVANPAPTRAETTDVANAVLDGADCIMLSEETAMGSYPVETVTFMEHIAEEAEALLFEVRKNTESALPAMPSEFLSYAACLLAEQSSAEALVAHSISGISGRTLSARRPNKSIFVLAPDITVRKYLNFSRGVIPCSVDTSLPGHLARAEAFVEASPDFPKSARVVITAGQSCGEEIPGGTNLVKIYTKCN